MAVLLVGSAIGVAGQTDVTARPAIPSAGCGSSSVEPGLQPDNVLDVDGLVRDWAMYVPEAHDGEVPLPLFLARMAVVRWMELPDIE